MSQLQGFLPPYINGHFVEHLKPDVVFHTYNPVNPKDILASAFWNKGILDELISGMQQAQRAFRLVPLEERLQLVQRFIDFLRQNAEEIKSNMMLELSRSRVTVENEWALCEELFTLLPAYCRSRLGVRSDEQGCEWSYAPLGLVLISTTVSLPVYSLLSSALPALVAGNAVCVRPSPHALLSGSLIASSIHQTGFPAGLIQVVYGDFEAYRTLALTHAFDALLYYGNEESVEQIRRDHATQPNVRLILGSGGKNAAYLSPSADIDRAIRHILHGAFFDAGQRLEATGLVFVHEKILLEFQEKFVHAVRQMPIGAREDLSRSDVHVMEPLCSNASWERFLRFQGIASRESDETLRWGKPIDTPQGGYFVSPGVHLMAKEKLEKSVYASNAFFGPDVCLVPLSDVGELSPLLENVSIMRNLAVHTASLEECREIRKLSYVPNVLWNLPTTFMKSLQPNLARGKAGGTRYGTNAGFLFAVSYPCGLIQP